MCEGGSPHDLYQNATAPVDNWQKGEEPIGVRLIVVRMGNGDLKVQQHDEKGQGMAEKSKLQINVGRAVGSSG